MYSIDEKIKAILKIDRCGKYAIDEMSGDLFSDVDIANRLLARAIKDDPKIFGMLSGDFRNDPDFSLKAVEKNGLAFEYLSDTLKSDKKIALAALKNNFASCEFFDSELMNDFDVGIELVKQLANKSGGLDSFKSLGVNLLGDKDFALIALKYTSDIYPYLSKELRDDYDICYAAVTRHGWAIEHIGLKYRWNKQICLAAAMSDGSAVQFMNWRFRGDYDVAMAAVLSEGYSIQFLTKKLKNDKNIALAALSNGGNFRDLGDDIKRDKDVVIMGASSGIGFELLPDEFKLDRDVVLALVSTRGEEIKKIGSIFRGDKEIVMAAVACDGFLIREIEDELKCDKDIALAAVRSRSEAYEYISDELKSDRDLIEAAFGSANPFGSSKNDLIERVSEEADSSLKKSISEFTPSVDNISRDDFGFEQALAVAKEYRRHLYYNGYEKLDIKWRLNKDIARAAVENGMLPRHLDETLIADKEFFLEVIRICGEGYRCHGFHENLPEELLRDNNFSISAVEICGDFIQFLPDIFRQNKDVVLAAVKNNGRAINFIHEACFGDPDLVATILSEAYQRSGIYIFEGVCEELLAKLRTSLEDEQIASSIGFCRLAYIKPSSLLNNAYSSSESLSKNNFDLEAVAQNSEKIDFSYSFDGVVTKLNRTMTSKFELFKKSCVKYFFFLMRRLFD